VARGSATPGAKLTLEPRQGVTFNPYRAAEEEQQRCVAPRPAPARRALTGHPRARPCSQQQQQRPAYSKSQAEVAFFHEMLSLPRSAGGRSELEFARDEQLLFAEPSQVGANFEAFDRIPVKSEGRGCETPPPLASFSDLFPDPDSVFARNVKLMGYAHPTPVQKHAIPFALAGRDLMCTSQTGSGKTAALLAPWFLRASQKSTIRPTVEFGTCPRALVLAPTRELCAQITSEARKFAHRTDFRVVQIIGGVPARPQLIELSGGADMIVATPGRILDYIDRGVVALSCCGYLVMDEADRMLDMGFEPQIRRIVEVRRRGPPPSDPAHPPPPPSRRATL
jgi:hypothetical protein